MAEEEKERKTDEEALERVKKTLEEHPAKIRPEDAEMVRQVLERRERMREAAKNSNHGNYARYGTWEGA